VPSRTRRHSKQKKRLRSLEAELSALQSGHPAYTESKKRIEKEILLVKAELRKSAKPRRSSQPAPRGRRQVPLPGAASFPSLKLPSPKSPTFYEDSVRSMSSLRKLCKQCMGYVQKADGWLDSLHGVGSHLHREGVLPKISQGKIKDLTTSDWTTLLMALMNSPLAGLLLGGGDAKKEEEAQGEASD